MKIPALLTGIVTLTGLYSINIKIMGGVPNLSIEILVPFSKCHEIRLVQ